MRELFSRSCRKELSKLISSKAEGVGYAVCMPIAKPGVSECLKESACWTLEASEAADALVMAG